VMAMRLPNRILDTLDALFQMVVARRLLAMPWRVLLRREA
jgi:hypothetical protein